MKKSKDEKKEIYVVLTQTNSMLASTIRKFTQAKYSHVSVSFNSNCKEMYSFGRKYYYIPFYGIFKAEDLNDKIFSGREDNTIAIYKLNVTKKELHQIRLNIKRIEKINKGFNVAGLAAAAIDVKLERDKYYCAEFVHEAIHEKTDLLMESDKAIKPEDIIKMNDDFELVFEGTIQDFLGDELIEHPKRWKKYFKHLR